MKKHNKPLLFSFAILSFAALISSTAIACTPSKEDTPSLQSKKNNKFLEAANLRLRLDDIDYNKINPTQQSVIKQKIEHLKTQFNDISIASNQTKFDQYYNEIKSLESTLKNDFNIDLTKEQGTSLTLGPIKQPIIEKESINNETKPLKLITSKHYVDYDHIFLNVSKKQTFKDVIKKLPKQINVNFGTKQILVSIVWQTKDLDQNLLVYSDFEIAGSFSFNSQTYEVKAKINVIDKAVDQTRINLTPIVNGKNESEVFDLNNIHFKNSLYNLFDNDNSSNSRWDTWDIINMFNELKDREKQIIIKFKQPQEINEINLKFWLGSISNKILPKSFHIQTSLDGINFKDVSNQSITDPLKWGELKVNDDQVSDWLPIKWNTVRASYLKIKWEYNNFQYQGWRKAILALTGLRIYGLSNNSEVKTKFSIIDDTISHFSIGNLNIKAVDVYDPSSNKFIIKSDKNINLNNLKSNLKVHFNNPEIKYSINLLEETYSKDNPNKFFSKIYVIKTYSPDGALVNKYIITINDKNHDNSNYIVSLANINKNDPIGKAKILEIFFKRINNYNYKSEQTYKYLKNLHHKLDYDAINAFDDNKIADYDNLIIQANFLVDNLKDFDLKDQNKNQQKLKLISNIKSLFSDEFLKYDQLKSHVSELKKIFSTSNNISDLRVNLENKIKDEKMISQQSKRELFALVKDEYIPTFDINLSLSAAKTKTKLEIKQLKQKLLAANLSDEIKSKFLIQINQITDYDQLVKISAEVKNIIKISSDIDQLISEAKQKISKQVYGAKKAFALYSLLVEYKSTYTTQLSSTKDAEVFLKKLKTWERSVNDQNSIKVAFEEVVNKAFDRSKIIEDNFAKWKSLDLLRFMNITSLNHQTANIMLKDLDTDFLDFEVANIALNESKDQSIITYQVTHKYNPDLTLKKQLSFKLPNEKVLTKIQALGASGSLDEYFEVDYYLLSKLNQQEFKNKFNLDKTNFVLGIELYANYHKETIRRKTKYVEESFEYRIKATPIYKDKKLVAIVQFLFNNNVILEKELITNEEVNFQTASANEIDDDAIDLAKAKSILDNRDDILTNTFLKKGLHITHQDYYPDQVLEIIPKLYDLPTFGKYKIAPKELVKAYDGGRDWGGIAETIWGVLKTETNKDGKVVSNWVHDAESPPHNIDHFKRYQYHNFIKPINNEKLEADDFISENELDKDIKDQIDLLNDGDIDFRKVNGKAESQSKTTQYRNLNIKEFINQNAFTKANYFLKLRDDDEKKKSIDSKLAKKIYKDGEYIPYDAGSIPTNTAWSKSHNKLIKDKTFYYFYDFKQLSNNSISFRLGFVKNNDRTKRYSPNKVFTIHNVVNDYEQNLYPEVMLNNLTYDNLSINHQVIATKTVDQWKANLDDFSQKITFKNANSNSDLLIDNNFITYKNFKLDKNYFKVADIKQYGSNKAFVRFKVLNLDQKWVDGKNWYLISNFKSTEQSKIEDLSWDNEKLRTIYYDNKKVKRTRELEPHIDDAEWKLKTDNEAIWKMDNKYIQHTLLSPNASNRELDLELYAGMLIFDNLKDERIISNNRTIKLKVDFDQLLISPFSYSSTFSEIIDNKKVTINYTLTIIYNHNDRSLSFSFFIDQPYGIKLGYPQNQRANTNIKFDYKRAVMIPYAPLRIKMSYINEIQNESDFGLGKTNLYDYKKANTSPSDQVHLLYNDASYYAKKIYNPNQNVYWKHNDGFIPNIQWIRDDWGTSNRDWDLVNRARDNGMKYVTYNRHPGSAGMLNKVNDDPSNLYLYYISNWHVGEFFPNINANQNAMYVKDAIEPPSINSPFISLPLNKWDSELYKGYGYYWPSQSSSLNVQAGITSPIYIGYNKDKNNSSTSVDELVDKSGKASSVSYDVQVTWSDFKVSYEHARRGLRDDIVLRFRNYLEAKPIKMNQSSDKNHQIVPVLNPLAHIGFPGWGFMTGYINARPNNTNTNFNFRQYPNYSPIQFGQGNSGSAIWSRDGEYTAIWRAGAHGSWSTGEFFDSYQNNFWGINWNNENPLDLKDFKHSVGHIILRQALNHPFKYKVPWFYKTK